MSADGDNVFARWSRRKQAVRRNAPQTAAGDKHASEAAAEAEADAEPADLPTTAEPDPPEPAEPLPRIEDLTAESDLSAFLRKGIPQALKSAAMRKMWSLDPAIRDYIGPSEYAWDFNKPGSMPGFGPLEPGEAVAEFLSTMSGGVRAGMPKQAAAAEILTAPQQPDGSPEQDASPAPKSPDDAASPDTAREPSPMPSPHPPSADQVAAATEPSEAENPAGQDRSASAPRHGRAMPR